MQFPASAFGEISYYCAEVFYTLSFWPFSFYSDHVLSSFLQLLSLAFEVSIRCDFRTLVQETNLNCTSKLSRFAGAEFRYPQLSWRDVSLDWEVGAGEWCRAGSCQEHSKAQLHTFSAFSLGYPILNPTPVPGCIPSWLGDRFPGICQRKGRTYAEAYLFYFLPWYQCLMILTWLSFVPQLFTQCPCFHLFAMWYQWKM